MRRSVRGFRAAGRRARGAQNWRRRSGTPAHCPQLLRAALAVCCGQTIQKDWTTATVLSASHTRFANGSLASTIQRSLAGRCHSFWGEEPLCKSPAYMHRTKSRTLSRGGTGMGSLADRAAASRIGKMGSDDDLARSRNEHIVRTAPRRARHADGARGKCFSCDRPRTCHRQSSGAAPSKAGRCPLRRADPRGILRAETWTPTGPPGPGRPCCSSASGSSRWSPRP